MAHRNDGGPAFPNVPDGAGDKWGDWDQGMSLRDWFAGQILAGHLSGATNEADVSWMRQHGAGYIYQIADAMIAAREAEGK